jgi:hypothetical protein
MTTSGYQQSWRAQGTRGGGQQRYSFNDDNITSALEAARQPYAGRERELRERIDTSKNPYLRSIGDCVDLRSGDNEVCLDLPLGLGDVCIPLPFDLPDGQAAQACLYICTTWGIPTGVTVRVTVGGFSVVDQSFGWGC